MRIESWFLLYCLKHDGKQSAGGNGELVCIVNIYDNKADANDYDALIVGPC